jgi:2,5-diketo-D-gluconate reductase A
MKESLFENSEFLAIARRHGKSMAQVLLRWQVQRGVVGPGCAGAVNRH